MSQVLYGAERKLISTYKQRSSRQARRSRRINLLKGKPIVWRLNGLGLSTSSCIHARLACPGPSHRVCLADNTDLGMVAELLDWDASLCLCTTSPIPSFCDVGRHCRRVWIACRWLDLMQLFTRRSADVACTFQLRRRLVVFT